MAGKSMRNMALFLMAAGLAGLVMLFFYL